MGTIDLNHWRHHYVKYAAVAGFLTKAGSILSLIRIGFDYCFAAVVAVLLDWFILLLDAVFAIFVDWWLLAILSALSSLIGLEIILFEHWRVILVLMLLKCGSDVFADLKRNQKFYAGLWFGWGLLVSFAASIASGLVPLDHQSLLPMLAPILGFVVYGLGQAIWLARFRVPQGRTSGEVFRYYLLRFSLADGVIGVLCLAVSFWLRDVGYPSPNVLAFFLYILGMAARDLAMPAWYVTFTMTDGGAWHQRYFGLSTTWTGLNTLIAFAAALLAMILNSGLVEITGQNTC